MILSYRDLASASEGHVEPIVIVGAGALGLLIATSLSASGKSVLVLEGGRSRDPQESTESPVQNTGDIATFVPGSYERGLGGSTQTWGGQILPFDEGDFSARPSIADTSWPFSRADLEIWYKKIESLIGVDYIGFGESLAGQELDTNAADSGLRNGFSKWCPQQNFAELFGQEITESNSIRIVLDCEVCDIEKDRNARGFRLHFKDAFGNQSALRASEVILAAGGLHNYCLIANSDLDSAKLPALGRYYHDHIGFYGARLIPIDQSNFNAVFSTKLRNGGRCLPKLQLASGFSQLNVNGTLEAQLQSPDAVDSLKNLYHLARGNRPAGELPVHLKNVLLRLPQAISAIYKMQVQGFVPLPTAAEYFLVANCETSPLIDSRISVSGEKGKKPTVQWRVDDSPRVAMLNYYERVKQYLEGNEIAEVIIKPKLYEPGRQWIEDAYSLFHHMGATRLGQSPATSVVDENCQVHGEQGLYVAGCSVLPTGSCSNPTFTALALGARLAEHIGQH